MYHVICQKCGASNREDAVVCIQCGTRLEHPERRMGARIWASGVPQMFLAAPVRLTKWILKKLKTLVVVAVSALVLGVVVLFFGLFAPFSWPDYPMPQPENDDDTELKNQMFILREKGGSFRADPSRMRQLGNLLIFNPDFGKRKPLLLKKDAASRPAPDREKGYFSAYKEGDNHFIFALYMKLHGKLPMRLVAEFEAARDQEGKLLLHGCRVGNLPVPYPLLSMAVAKMLGSWHAGQQFVSVCDRLEQAKMDLRSGTREDTLTVTVRPASRR